MAKTKKATPRKTAPRKVSSRKAPAPKGAAKRAAKRAAKARAAGDVQTATPMRTVTPYLAVGDAARAIEWYRKAFGAKENARMPAPDGRVMHCELRLGDTTLYVSDLFPGTEMKDPAQAGPSVTLHLWHRDVDKLWRQAVDAGARVVMPLDDQFWGDRYGKLLDPFGHSWSLSHKSKLGKKALDAKREEAMREFAAMGERTGA